MCHLRATQGLLGQLTVRDVRRPRRLPSIARTACAARASAFPGPAHAPAQLPSERSASSRASHARASAVAGRWDVEGAPGPRTTPQRALAGAAARARRPRRLRGYGKTAGRVLLRRRRVVFGSRLGWGWRRMDGRVACSTGCAGRAEARVERPLQHRKQTSSFEIASVTITPTRPDGNRICGSSIEIWANVSIYGKYITITN